MFHLFSFNVTGRVVILSADFHKQSKEALESFQSDGTDLVVGRACFGECNLLNVSNLNFEKNQEIVVFHASLPMCIICFSNSSRSERAEFLIFTR